MHIRKIVLARQDYFHFDASQNRAVDRCNEVAVWNEIGGHDPYPLSGRVETTIEKPAQLFEIFVGSGANSPTESFAVLQGCGVAGFRGGLLGDELPIFEKCILDLTHNRSADAEMKIAGLFGCQVGGEQAFCRYSSPRRSRFHRLRSAFSDGCEVCRWAGTREEKGGRKRGESYFAAAKKAFCGRQGIIFLPRHPPGFERPRRAPAAFFSSSMNCRPMASVPKI